MSRRLVKTIRATRVGVDTDAWSAATLTDDERALLTGIYLRHRDAVDLRKAGISQPEFHRLEFLRWRVRNMGLD